MKKLFFLLMCVVFAIISVYCTIVGITATSGAYWYMACLSFVASVVYGILLSKWF